MTWTKIKIDSNIPEILISDKEHIGVITFRNYIPESKGHD